MVILIAFTGMTVLMNVTRIDGSEFNLTCVNATEFLSEDAFVVDNQLYEPDNETSQFSWLKTENYQQCTHFRKRYKETNYEPYFIRRPTLKCLP